MNKVNLAFFNIYLLLLFRDLEEALTMGVDWSLREGKLYLCHLLNLSLLTLAKIKNFFQLKSQDFNSAEQEF